MGSFNFLQRLFLLHKLFDVAFKQSLYDKGYVKNVPGAPMCGCIEQVSAEWSPLFWKVFFDG